MQILSNFSAPYSRSFHVRCYACWVVVTRCRHGALVSVLASLIRASIQDPPHGEGAVSPRRRQKFSVTVRPWYLSESSSLSSALGVGLVWVLGCPVITVVGCWCCSLSRSDVRIHRCLICGVCEWIRVTVHIYRDSRIFFSHLSSDIPLRSSCREQKTSHPFGEEGSVGWCGQGSFRADACY